MSGGKEKKASRSSKAQGWEEAGAEFYQESYPGEVENVHRDPSKLATLLPSKQTRVGELFSLVCFVMLGADTHSQIFNYKSIPINFAVGGLGPHQLCSHSRP